MIDTAMAPEHRLTPFFQEIGEVLGHPKRRASFATYALGLLNEGERKSVEPIAARACPDPLQVDAAHQRLLHFLTDSDWSDHEVRRVAAEYGVGAMLEQGSIETWIVDDTGFIKQGRHSVGVQRQYTGSAGKVTNCQIGVSLSIATRTEHLPIDFELYLPESWTEDEKRRKEARIPDDLPFQTKPELALQMMRRAVVMGIPPGVLLADAAYGNSFKFRAAVRDLGLPYAVGIEGSTKVWMVDRKRRFGAVAWSAKELALWLGKKCFRRTTWREGTRGRLCSNFAMRRVVVAHGSKTPDPTREDLWLLAEWPDGEAAPTKYFLLTFPWEISRREAVRLVKERYRTERVYEDLKGELGLDHFEGRRFSGWHHHVSVALSCYAFVVAERVRSFPPSAAREGHTGEDERAA